MSVKAKRSTKKKAAPKKSPALKKISIKDLEAIKGGSRQQPWFS